MDKVRVVAEHLKRMPLDFAVDGEIQVDAAISPIVAKVKGSAFSHRRGDEYTDIPEYRCRKYRL